MTFYVHTTSHSKISGSSKLSWLVTTTRQIILEVVKRQGLKSNIGKLSARDLRDAGLTENDVTSAQGASWAASASELLSEARRTRAGNW